MVIIGFVGEVVMRRCFLFVCNCKRFVVFAVEANGLGRN